ncbi:MAG TPA: MATE family efflux transporter [Polyangiales bacterium]|nr:MATE family efflux transporter [Polyangiales bacterium]
MRDLTQGPIVRHQVSIAVPLAVGMVFQTLYYFVDLYFVAQLGDNAIAGVSAAGNSYFAAFALSQLLGVGTAALISHAVGRKDPADANLVFNQSLCIAALMSVLTLIGTYGLSELYLRSVTDDIGTVQEGKRYLFWFGPGLALQFALVSMGSALRGTGIVKPAMMIQVGTLLLNALLAPVFIAGWGTNHPLGVAGAGLASSVAISVGVIALTVYFVRVEKYVRFHRDQWRPRMQVWKRIFVVGLPAGCEFALIFLYTSITYWAIRSFGAAAQAGFGVGSRVMQGIFVPALAVAYSAAPIAGQNFGAGNFPRVRATFRSTAFLSSFVMTCLIALCQWNAEIFVRFFSSDAEVTRIGALFLRTVSWNFVAQGLIFSCSNMFQGLGNTLPAVWSSITRLLIYALPAVWLSQQSFFQLEYIWYWSIVATGVQALTSLGLLQVEYRRRLV